MARELPDGWDDLATSCMQRREFLSHIETHNPRRQRYWLLQRDGRTAAGMAVHTTNLALTRLNLPLRTHVIGMACPTSASGLLGDGASARTLLEHVLCNERGFVIGLNLEAPIDSRGVLTVRALPSVELRRHFSSWGEYLGLLRADYRRRLLRLTAAFRHAQAQSGPCSRFDDAAYALYLQVYARSRFKLHDLSQRFITNLPVRFRLTTYREGGQLVGWHICRRDGDSFHFFLGGLDYRHNARLNLYFNLLAGVLREGISAGARIIDFGQTAEVPKMRLGGSLFERHTLAFHRHPVGSLALKAFGGRLEYHRRVPPARVFKVGSAISTTPGPSPGEVPQASWSPSWWGRDPLG